MRKILSLVAGASLLLASMPSALACSCLRPDVEKQFGEAAAVFTAKVTKVEKLAERLSIRATLAPETWWKGEAVAETTITTAADSAACGFGFKEGEEYLVFAYGEAGTFSTNLCSPTAALEHAAETIQMLDTLQAPSK